MANQIQLKGGFRSEEALASGTVTPGMLLERTSADAVKAHATEGGYAERLFAVEDALQGNTVSTNYTTGTLVSYNVVDPGAVVNALIEAGQTITIGEAVISSGNGLLKAYDDADSSVTVRQIIGFAEAAVDLSASSAVNTLCAVRLV